MPRFVALSGLLHVALSAVGHPLSVVKTRLQHAGVVGVQGPASASASPPQQQRSGAALRAARAALGARGLYVGFWPATLGALPAEGAYVVALEAARQALAPPQGQRCVVPREGFVATPWLTLSVAAAAVCLRKLRRRSRRALPQTARHRRCCRRWRWWWRARWCRTTPPGWRSQAQQATRRWLKWLPPRGERTACAASTLAIGRCVLAASRRRLRRCVCSTLRSSLVGGGG